MLVIWHNPRCRKSRETLSILEEASVKVSIRHYLQDVPSIEELSDILGQLGFEDPRQLMRRSETIYKDLNLKAEENPALLVKYMAENPILIERPIVTNGQRAIIGRPPEAVKGLL